VKKLFELHQKITLFVNEYQVLEDAAPEGQKLVGYVKQKRLALREKFTLFKDETQAEVVAISTARSILDFGAIYDIAGGNGKPLAAAKKNFGKSLLNSTWTIYDTSVTAELFSLREKSQFIAILRRVWGFIPYANDIPFPIKYHFVILRNSQVIGEYIKITRFRDHYALYLDEQYEKVIDPRAWMIVAVLLDAMQSR
jgi:uncharacterized protein YxjI